MSKILLYDEYGIPIYRSNSKESRIALDLIITISIQYFLDILSHFVERLKELVNVNKDMSESLLFIEVSILRRMSSFISIRLEEMKKACIDQKMNCDKMSCYLVETTMAPLWSLLLRIADAKTKLRSLFELGEDENEDDYTFVGSDDEESSGELGKPFKTDVAYVARENIVSFCVNSKNPDHLALGTLSNVREISVKASLNFFKVFMRY
jgi:hypothetical protein